MFDADKTRMIGLPYGEETVTMPSSSDTGTSRIDGRTDGQNCYRDKKVKVKERIVLREIHLRTTGRHLSMGSHSVICHLTEVTAPPSPQPDRLVLDLSTHVRMKG